MTGTNDNFSDQTDIKPVVTAQEVTKLLETFYGFRGGSAKQLQGFDDLNYYVLPNTNENQFVNKLWPHGYVLKIMNSLDSKNESLCEGQNALMLFLREHGIPCPVPVRTVHGSCYFKEKFPSTPSAQVTQKEHIVRLLEFQPGVVLKDAPKSCSLFFRLGMFVGQLTEVLKKFSHPVYKTHYSIWHLKSMPEIKFSLHVVENPRRRALVERIVDEFTRNVLTKMEAFEQGMIHGDLNENNILMVKGESGEWEISSVIDLGDSHESCYLFELAIMLCYMMFECKRHGLDLLIGTGHLLAGYLTRRPNFPLQCGLLKLSICARISQSLVLGLKAFQLQPQNKYVLESQEMGWPILEELWPISDERITEVWESVFQSYGIK